MPSIYEHTQSNVLVIPQGLYGMKDIDVLWQQGDAALFYKCLEQDLVDIEFYTNVPCFIYIESGREVLTNSENDIIELNQGQGIFLPQGINLHSDFVKQTSLLKAYLFFFGVDAVTDFLSGNKDAEGDGLSRNESYCVVGESNHEFQRFFHGIEVAVANDHYFHLKSIELLHLIAWLDKNKHFHSLLKGSNRLSSKRNLKRLLSNHELLHLSVSDLANLSGRSVSSFNRDFKALYQMTPKKWLQEKRLTHAKTLLNEQDMSVTDVAVSVGYENVSNFIKAFKQQYGMTPNQMKR